MNYYNKKQNKCSEKNSNEQMRKVEGREGHVSVRITIPDVISDEAFRVWLDQSINTASHKLYRETYQYRP